MPLHCEPGFVRDYATRLLLQVIKSCCPVLLSLAHTRDAIHSTKISENLGPKLNGSVRSNRESFEKTGPPFEVDYFSRSDQLEFWLNGSCPLIQHRSLIDPSVTLIGRERTNWVCLGVRTNTSHDLSSFKLKIAWKVGCMH